ELRAQLHELETYLLAGWGALDTPAIVARVLEVDEELHRVVLDKGLDDGVKVGFVFGIHRGATLVGLVRIQDVQASTSSGTIVYAHGPIHELDRAATTW